jgi:hypothetical protein
MTIAGKIVGQYRPTPTITTAPTAHPVNANARGLGIFIYFFQSKDM